MVGRVCVKHYCICVGMTPPSSYDAALGRHVEPAAVCHLRAGFQRRSMMYGEGRWGSASGIPPFEGTSAPAIMMRHLGNT